MKHLKNQFFGRPLRAFIIAALAISGISTSLSLTAQVPSTARPKQKEPVQTVVPQTTKTSPAQTQTQPSTSVQAKPKTQVLQNNQVTFQSQQFKTAETVKSLPVYSIAGSQLQTAQLQPGASTQLKPNQSLLVAKTGISPLKISPRVPLGTTSVKQKYFALPETYYARLSTGKEATLNLVYCVERPLRRMKGKPVFDGSLIVFLEDADKPNEQQTLTQPVMLEVAAPVDQIAPERISLTHTNLPSTSINFQAGYPADSVSVKLITSVHTEGYTTYLPVLPAIDFPGSGQSLQGWGLEQIPVTIQLRGITGQQSYSIALEASDGSVNPTTVTLRGGEPQTVHFRSRGLHGGVLRASNPLLESAEAQFAYRIPFAFMIAALLGGLVGGYFRFSSGEGAPGSGGRRFLSGLLGGLLGAGAYSAGVNLLGDSFPTFPYFSEIVTFVVAALAGGALSFFTKGKVTPN